MVRAKTLVDPPGQHAERGLRAGQAVGGLIEGAVTSEDYGCVQSVGRRTLCQPSGMASSVCLFEYNVVVRRKCFVYHDPSAGGNK